MLFFFLLSVSIAVLLLHPISAMPSNDCSLKIIRTIAGAEITCSCVGTHTTKVPVTASSGVDFRCYGSCLSASKAMGIACFFRDSKTFESQALVVREICCNACDGTYQGNTCFQPIPDTTPLSPPPTGCRSKVTNVSGGLSFSSTCAEGPTVVSNFFVAAGVDRACIRACASKRMMKLSKAGQSFTAIQNAQKKSFKTCCRCGASKNGVLFNGENACGFMTSPSNPIIIQDL